jgi:hypothetical protein
MISTEVISKFERVAKSASDKGQMVTNLIRVRNMIIIICRRSQMTR